MARLTLSLLGPLQALVDGEPAVGFATAKVRALLAYLAVEAHRPHTREALAALLWPDWPGRHALGNLRQALANLRATLRDRDPDDAHPLLLVSRESIQFNRASDHLLDVAAFAQRIREIGPEAQRAGIDDEERISTLTACVQLYRGPFLDGLSLDSAPYEEWLTLQREYWQREVLSALQQLAELHEERGDYAQAQECGRRALALEPTDERWHRQLMRSLALGGERSAALAQYQVSTRVLDEELGVKPAPETVALYEEIRRGALAVPMRPAAQVTSAQAASEQTLPLPESDTLEAPRRLFVAREQELAQLDQWLTEALRGRGRVGFVVGEPGSGKTMLLREFAYRAMQAHPNLIVAGGTCNGYAGMGDPYLPFVETLRLLTGDVEAERLAGAVSRENARRLQATAPEVLHAVLHGGLAVIDVLLPGATLLEQARRLPDGVTWAARVQEMLDRRSMAPSQAFLFDQATYILHAVAQSHPLVLILDDLQWADAASISLLFHLGRRTAGHRLLILGAFRPEEVAAGREGPAPRAYPEEPAPRAYPEGKAHPLQAVLRELQRVWGKMYVDLDHAQGDSFLESLIDSEPNRLEAPFRQALYRHTGGHALFTVELLRGLQERGDLLRDSEGRWVAGPSLDWDALPERVEAVIAERIERLSGQEQELLSLASVEGEEFHAEVAARVLHLDEGKVLAALSGPLSQEHRLLRARSMRRLGERSFSRYRFQHYLFQRYLYQRLDPVRCAYLHGAVASALEALGAAPTGGTDSLDTLQLLANDFADRHTGSETIVSEATLAWHWEEAGLAQRAAHYHHRAARRITTLTGAYQEAGAHASKALDLLATIPESPQRTRLEYLAYHTLARIRWRMGDRPASEIEEALCRSLERAERTGDALLVADALSILATSERLSGDLDRSLALSQRAVDLSQGGPPGWVMRLQGELALAILYRGDFATSIELLAPLVDALHDTSVAPPRDSVRLTYVNLNRVEHAAWALWCQGYADQALAISRETLAVVRRDRNALDIDTEAMVLCGATCFVHQLRREPEGVAQGLELLLPLVDPPSSAPRWYPWAMFYMGWVHTHRDQLKEGLAKLRLSLADPSARVAQLPYRQGCLAEVLLCAGHVDEGLAVIEEALAQVQRTKERWSEAELWRIRGELLLQREGPSFQRSYPNATLFPPKAWERGETATVAAASCRAPLEDAEACFRQAIAVAQKQEAKSWELRSTTSLARLLRDQGRPAEARELLAAIYGWFTEGFDTPDLVEAKALLEELDI